MLIPRDFRNFPISDISGGLLCGIGVVRKKGDVRVPLIQGGWGMIPQKILKSSSSEKQFPTFWTSNRIVFMKIFTAIW